MTTAMARSDLETLTTRWYKLRYHREQQRLWNSPARFKVIAAGRRSGKTELAKRKIVQLALRPTRFDDAFYALAAPTHAQAKKIFWEDLKKLVKPEWRKCRPSESDLTIRLINGSEIYVGGLDKPERFEGSPLDGIMITEFANIKKNAWKAHLRPALSDRNGWSWLEGVPEGRNHFYIHAMNAKLESSKGWDYFHWISADILPKEEIEAARAELDPLTFSQEYEASFVNFEGRAYYSFDMNRHATEELRYAPDLDLIFCFDFNVSPGTASILQEQPYMGRQLNVARRITAIIGEVYIQDNSNTIKICRRLLQAWGQHKGNVYIYGDPSGGARGTAKVEGSDWDLVKKVLKPVYGQRLKFRIDKGPPRERVRVNAVNSRLRTSNGVIKMMMDPKHCPHVADDFDAVTVKDDGSGEIDKKIDPMATHFTDGIGYYIQKKWPVRAGAGLMTSQF